MLQKNQVLHGRRNVIEIINKNIDHGRAFDWGKTSEDYAKYRDIYPKEFYAKLAELSLGVKGQNVLDLGTGTGVIIFMAWLPEESEISKTSEDLVLKYNPAWTGGRMTRIFEANRKITNRQRKS